MNKEDFCILDENDQICYLNWGLAQKQGLEHDSLVMIVDLHIERVQYFKKAKRAKTCHKWGAIEAAVRALEFDLQEVWKFPLDSSKHVWVNKIPPFQYLEKT